MNFWSGNQKGMKNEPLVPTKTTKSTKKLLYKDYTTITEAPIEHSLHSGRLGHMCGADSRRYVQSLTKLLRTFQWTYNFQTSIILPLHPPPPYCCSTTENKRLLHSVRGIVEGGFTAVLFVFFFREIEK